MTDSMTPREFHERFTRPAVEHWRRNQNVDHLAIHALSQIAILAEVAGHRSAEPNYRRQLEARYEPLRKVRDAVNSHKHGWPRKGDRREFFTQGQRAVLTTGAAIFAGATFLGGGIDAISLHRADARRW
jgi:hypothetical protein